MAHRISNHRALDVYACALAVLCALAPSSAVLQGQTGTVKQAHGASFPHRFELVNRNKEILKEPDITRLGILLLGACTSGNLSSTPQTPFLGTAPYKGIN